MSGFSAEWLRLREPADVRARDRGLLTRLVDYLREAPSFPSPIGRGWREAPGEGLESVDSHAQEQRRGVRILDLGCGTGANLRAMADALPFPQDWRLVDHDPPLLETANRELAAWAGARRPDLRWNCSAADLSAHIERVLDGDHDLVTASAFFDLVSESWLDRFVAALAERRLPLYTVLIFDGLMRWHPPHEADDAICSAFAAHQRTDKGFGSAAGPDATSSLALKLVRAGYSVHTAASPWLLDADTAQGLLAATATCIADAAHATGLVTKAVTEEWLVSRQAAKFCEIGHVDVLALPCVGLP